MALIPPFFLDCVTAIGRRRANGEITYHATGFLYGRFRQKDPTDGTRLHFGVYLVTNRHVFAGQLAAVVRFNPPAGQPGRVYDLELVDKSGKELWVTHDDSEIDIAATSISARLLREHGIVFSYFQSHAHLMGRERAKATGVSEGDGVFTIGFPLGDPGGERNHAVVRHGVIARIRDYLAGGAKSIIVDASIFPGNSGGPVVTHPENIAITGTSPPASANLLGVVSGYVPYRDIAVSQQTGMTRIVFEENTGLAVVVPIDYVTEIVERAESVKHAPSEAQEPTPDVKI
jgi:S1-C subfamily serine protease